MNVNSGNKRPGGSRGQLPAPLPPPPPSKQRRENHGETRGLLILPVGSSNLGTSTSKGHEGVHRPKDTNRRNPPEMQDILYTSGTWLQSQNPPNRHSRASQIGWAKVPLKMQTPPLSTIFTLLLLHLKENQRENPLVLLGEPYLDTLGLSQNRDNLRPSQRRVAILLIFASNIHFWSPFVTPQSKTGTVSIVANARFAPQGPLRRTRPSPENTGGTRFDMEPKETPRFF